jgi:hypothetical protein
MRYDDERLYLVRYIDPHGLERNEEQLAEDAEEAISMVERGWIPSADIQIVEVFMKLNGSWNATDDDYDGQPDEAQEWESYDPDC